MSSQERYGNIILRIFLRARPIWVSTVFIEILRTSEIFLYVSPSFRCKIKIILHLSGSFFIALLTEEKSSFLRNSFPGSGEILRISLPDTSIQLFTIFKCFR